MNSHVAAEFIRQNFSRDDLLALVLIDKRSGDVKPYIRSAQQIGSPEALAWITSMNDQHYEVYLTVNTLHVGARGRTKKEIAAIRHVYLDIDEDGDRALERLRYRTDIPLANHLLQTSKGKWQVLWRVDGFAKGQDEALMQALGREIGADRAVHDLARILRVPGFYNHKYTPPHLVTVETLTDRIYTPADFPRFEIEQSSVSIDSNGGARMLPSGHESQSERDFRYALRALSRGEHPSEITAAIADYRRNDKPHVQAYAQRTVRNAQRIAAQQGQAI